MTTYRTHRVMIKEREVPIMLSAHMERALREALGRPGHQVRATGPTHTALRRRGLVGSGALTTQALPLATWLRDEVLEGEPNRPLEYRFHPAMTAHDRADDGVDRAEIERLIRSFLTAPPQLVVQRLEECIAYLKVQLAQKGAQR